MKKYWLILLPVVMIVVGQTLAKFGVQKLQKYNQVMNIFIICGYCLLIFRGVIWIWVVRRFKLSLAYPMISITYVFILLISHYFFYEPLTAQNIVGAFLLVGGVCCVGVGEFKNKKTESRVIDQ
jgi:drug/metabolite transporter (DMT)-like permease